MSKTERFSEWAERNPEPAAAVLLPGDEVYTLDRHRLSKHSNEEPSTDREEARAIAQRMREPSDGPESAAGGAVPYSEE